MIVAVQGSFDTKTNLALEHFEESFEYPLNEGQNFSISHGRDYLRFFREMGEVTCFLAKAEGQIRGALTTVLRVLHTPTGVSREVVYLCDLKISPENRSSGLFFKLAKAAKLHYQGRVSGAYAIVMGGTERTPDHYTGAWGIPKFSKLGEVAILRIPVHKTESAVCDLVSVQKAREVFGQLASSSFYLSRELQKTGSRFEPQGLVGTRGRACGIVEDTLSCKRLLSQGKELMSAHLSDFAYTNFDDGLAIVKSAINLCARRAIPALFVSVPVHELNRWLAPAAFPTTTPTNASIYGLGLPQDQAWNINTSEV